MKPLLIVAVLLYLIRSKAPSSASLTSAPSTSTTATNLLSDAPAPVDTPAPTATTPADPAIALLQATPSTSWLEQVAALTGTAIALAGGAFIDTTGNYVSAVQAKLPPYAPSATYNPSKPYNPWGDIVPPMSKAYTNPYDLALLQKASVYAGQTISLGGGAYFDGLGHLSVPSDPGWEYAMSQLNSQGQAVAPNPNYNLFDPNTLEQI